MIINFPEMEEVIVHNMRGGEKSAKAKRFGDDLVRLAVNTLEPGASVGYHQHTDDCEIFFILEGNGKVIVENGEEEKVSAGMCHYCPKGSFHSLVNDSDKELVVFAVVPKQ